MIKFSSPVFICFLLISCAGSREVLFNSKYTPLPPDYSNRDAWAALPDVVDQADRTPNSSMADNQETAKADVFYIHPTTFTSKRKKNLWNASLQDVKLNKKTDQTAILYQATTMNGSGRIYAPRYRQAHLNSYFTRDIQSAEKAFDLAYSDVKAAFEHYLNYLSEGRPFIIATHSQGTQHAIRLLKEFVDGKDLQERLIVAYLVGMPVKKNFFNKIPICETPEQTACFCSWRSYRRGYSPPLHKDGGEIAITNPLSWTTSLDRIDRVINEGAVLKNFNKVRRGVADAQIHDGLLWLDRPKFPWSFLLTTKNYHVGDYNLFYVNIRNNAILRTKSYLRKK